MAVMAPVTSSFSMHVKAELFEVPRLPRVPRAAVDEQECFSELAEWLRARGAYINKARFDEWRSPWGQWDVRFIPCPSLNDDKPQMFMEFDGSSRYLLILLISEKMSDRVQSWSLRPWVWLELTRVWRQRPNAAVWLWKTSARGNSCWKSLWVAASQWYQALSILSHKHLKWTCQLWFWFTCCTIHIYIYINTYVIITI